MRDFMTIVKALADENRVRTLMVLRNGELCVCQIIEFLGLAPSTVSKHMSILKQARLVESRKEGRWVYYRLADEETSDSTLSALHWVTGCLTDDPLIKRDSVKLERLIETSCPENKLC